ncbi:MAG: hypothetical protein K0Q48_453 [Bacillota bacterium]|nr:hypothetical protein [Bacillota bacterium]
MIEVLRTELAELSEKLDRIRKIEAMLKNLQLERDDLLLRQTERKKALLKEESDVDRLERVTLTSIFYTILGRKDDKLRNEDQEAYSARLKYEAAERQLSDCEMHMEELKREMSSLSGCPLQYQRVFDEIQKLLQRDPNYANRLCPLEKQLGIVESQIRELDEAIRAGHAVQRQIESIADSLDSAEGWGTWDMLGGGLISTMAKHSHLDEAQTSVEYLQKLLSRFRTELADVSLDANLGTMNTDGFIRFADYFFDGLIADWTVLSQIHASQERVQELNGQIANILSTLTNKKAARIHEKASIENEISKLVATPANV